MIQIDDVVKKLFGYNREQHDINSVEYMKKAIKDAPDRIGQYYEYGSDRAIKDFLFEQSDIAKQLQKIMEKVNEIKEKNPESIH
jgi:hypothetical protein